MTQFQAMIVEEVAVDGGKPRYERRIGRRSTDDLPDGDLLIRVHYSSLNYKDALSATGNRGVTRRFPHTPGIDAAGVVVASAVDTFAPGDDVIVIGYDLGMNTAGGYGEYIRVPAGWAVKRPDGLSLRESMILGTAGFTAAMSAERIVEHGVAPDAGPVLVTGATGGVGSIAVALLARLGYTVTAATGKADRADFLHRLGATEVISREEAAPDNRRPLLRGRWSAVVDTVGGGMLAAALKETHYGAPVTCCGLVASAELNTTVLPFILRGVTLYGVDSVECDISVRQRLWPKLAGPWRLDILDAVVTERSLETLDPEIDRILAGQQVGRVLVKL